MASYQTYADKIKHSVTMQDVALRYGFVIDHRTHKIQCPFHSGDNNASLHLYSGDGGFFCFGCNAHGTVIDFVMQLFNLSFIEACKKMDNDFHLRLNIGEEQTAEQRKQAEREYLKRIEEKRRVEMKRKQLYTTYFSCLDRYTALDMIVIEEKPTAPDQPVSGLYIYACKRIDEAWEDVEEALAALQKFEKEHGKKRYEIGDTDQADQRQAIFNLIKSEGAILQQKTI